MANCGCNCSPCSCGTSGGEGCVSDLCAPRATFFNGQLIGADDLNVAALYSRSKDLLLGRFVGGWGIFGGLVATAAPGIQSAGLAGTGQIGPNPAILAGTTVQVSAGVAIDALGRTLTLCSPVTLDLAAMALQAPTAPQTHTCSDWFPDLQIPACMQSPGDITATEYFLVAEYTETSARPAPQFSGGGACDPAPTCEFSRKIEGVRFSLVPAPLPDDYIIHGCLLPQAPIGAFDQEPSGSLAEFLNESADVAMAALAAQCCSRPAVVICRVLFTSDPGSLKPEGFPTVPVYSLLQNDYEKARRVVPSLGLVWQLLLMLSGMQNDSGPWALGRVLLTGGAHFTTNRGFGSSVLTSGDEYTLTLNQSLSADQRIVSLTVEVSSADNPANIAAEVLTSSTDNSLTVRIVAPGGAVARAFHIVVQKVNK